MKYIYLASPYSAPTARERERRATKVAKKAGKIMETGVAVFCPIAHSHPIGLHIKRPQDHAFWMTQDLPLLFAASALWVYKMKGWEKSRGVAQEIAFAKKHNIPIKYLEA